MMLMNIAETKTTPTATFWLMRTATAFLSPRLNPRDGSRASRLSLTGDKLMQALEIPLGPSRWGSRGAVIPTDSLSGRAISRAGADPGSG